MTQIQELVEALKALGITPGNRPQKAKGGRKVKAKGRGRQKLTEAEKAVFMARNDAECVATFEAAGYKDVRPRETVLTYDKWIELKARRVRKGEKGLRVGPFNLFHESQTELLTAVAAPTSATVQ